jgi:hypothetical protein
MARFFIGLNHEIQDILEYKDYADITHLFHFACKAEREVQGRHASVKTNFSARRTNSWQHNKGRTTPPLPSPSRVAPSMMCTCPGSTCSKLLWPDLLIGSANLINCHFVTW